MTTAMICKLTIDRIYFATQPKAGGQSYVDKFSGKPKKLVSIYSSQLPKGVKSVSMFAVEGSPVWDWKEKQEVVIDIEQKGEYWNFKPASEGMIKLMDLEFRVEVLETLVHRMKFPKEKVEPKMPVDDEPHLEKLSF